MILFPITARFKQFVEPSTRTRAKHNIVDRFKNIRIKNSAIKIYFLSPVFISERKALSIAEHENLQEKCD